MDIKVGFSGWIYPAWRNHFYPKGLKQKEELAYAAKTVNTLEINGTFYSLQKPASFQKWHVETPDDFVFTVKGGRFISHILRLKECEQALNNFFASGILCLGKKLGPILWQFPPFMTLKDDRFEKFLQLLPKTTSEAARLAEGYNEKMTGRAHTQALNDQPIQYAFEFRHKSFENQDFIQMLKEHNIAFVSTDSIEPKWPSQFEPTANFTYLRVHGDDPSHEYKYSDAGLAHIEKLVETWKNHGVKQSYVLFNIEAKQDSPLAATRLLKRLKTT